MSHVTIKGSKGGGGSFKQTPDNLRSDDTFEGVLGLAIGPIKGPTRGLKSIKLDGTALENENGELNYADFVAQLGDGDPTKFPQKVQLKLGAGASPLQVGTTFANTDGTNPIWVTRTLNNTNADFIDLRFIVNQLFRQNKKGIYSATATLELEMKPTGSATWINPTLGEVKGNYNEQGSTKGLSFKTFLPESAFQSDGTPTQTEPNFRIHGKTTSPAVYELRVAVPNDDAYADTTWDVRVRLLERDHYQGGDDGVDQEQRNITWESMSAVYSTTFGEDEDWRGVSWLSIYGKASDQLTSVPTVTVEGDWKIVSVPPANVYNPETRQYLGVTWDGSWSKAWTNDPAWIINDAISDSLSGISLIAPGSYLNKWDALEMSKWCSELVSDGAGGLHPRFSLNIAIREAVKAEEFVRYLAGAVGGLAWDQGNGEWRVKMDKPEAPVDIFTLDNIEGEFFYSHTDVDTRYNQVTMTFLNEEMDYREDRVKVYRSESIAKIGLKPTTLVAVGCTNRQEALRRAVLRVESTTEETRVVNFTTNRRGRNIQHLDTILVSDGDLGEREQRTHGRTIAVSADRKTIQLRDSVYLAAGITYTLVFSTLNSDYAPNPASEPASSAWNKPTIVARRTVVGGSGQTARLTLDEALPADAPDNLTVALEANGLVTIPKLYRVTNVVYDDDGERVAISALEVNTAKWERADNASKEDTVFTNLRGAVPAPLPPADGRIISVTRSPADQGENVTLSINWQRPAGAFISGFRVRYRVNGGEWQLLTDRTQNTSVDIVNPVSGVYEAEVVTIDRRGGMSLPLVGDTTVDPSIIGSDQILYPDGTPISELQPGEPGADITSNITGLAVVEVECDPDGVPLSGELPLNVGYRLMRSDVDVTAEATWSMEVVSGTINASIAAGVLTINSMATSGVLRLTAVHFSKTRTLDVTVTQQRQTALAASIRQAEAAIAAALETIEDLEAEADEAQNQVDAAIDAINGEIDDIRATAATTKTALESEIGDLQGTAAQIQADAAATRSSLEASQGDIAAQGASISQAQADIVAAGGRISTVEQTLGDQGASISSISQTVDNHTGRLATVESTVSTQGASISENASAISTVQGDVASLSQTVSAQGASISQNATAIGTTQGDLASLSSTVTSQGASITTLQSASSSQAGNIATLQQQVTAGNPNMLRNPSFSEGLVGWTYNGALPGTSLLQVQNPIVGYYADVTGLSSSSTGLGYVDADPVSAYAQSTYTCTCNMQVVGSGPVRGWIELIYLDSSGTEITRTTGPGVTNPTLGGTVRNALIVSGASPAGTSKILVRIVFTGDGNRLTQVVFNQAKLEIGYVATAFSDEVSVRTQYQAISSNTTQLSSLSTTVSTQGGSITTLQSSMTTAQGNISTLQSTVSSQGGSITTLQQTVSAQGGTLSTLSTTVSSQGGQISSLQSASTTQAGSIASLQQSVTAANNANLLPNGSFENGLTNWRPSRGGWSAGNVNGWGYSAGNATDWPNNGFVVLESPDAPIYPSNYYTLSADMGMFLSGSGYAGSHYLELRWYDANGSVISAVGSASRNASVDFDPTGASRQYFKITALAPGNAVTARGAFVWYKSSGVNAGIVARQMKIERGGVATNYTPDATVGIAFSAISANGTSIATLNSTVSTQGASITTAQSAITTLQGSVSTLQSTVSTQGSAITTLQSTTSTQSGDIATLKQNISAGGSNLLSNTEFVSGLGGWGYGMSGQTAVDFAVNGAGATYQVNGINAATIHQNNSSNAGYSEYAQYFPVIAGKLYEVSFWYGAHRCNVSSYFLFFDGNGNVIGNSGGSLVGLPEVFTNRGDMAGWSRRAYKTTVAPAGAIRGRLHLRKEATAYGTDSWAWFMRPQVVETTEAAPSPQRYSNGLDRVVIETQATALSNLNGQYATLSSTVSTQGSTISSQATAISTLQGNYSSLSSTVSSQGSTINNQASAISNLQGQTASLDQRVSAGSSPNLVKNSSFENGTMSGWSQAGATWNVSTTVNSSWGPYAASTTAIGGGAYAFITSDPIYVEQGYYTLSGDMGFFINGGSGVMYLEINWYDANDNFISGVGGPGYNQGYNFDISGDKRKAMAFSAYTPGNASIARARCVWRKDSGTISSMHARQIKFERGQLATPYSNEAVVATSYQAVNSLNSQYASLSSTVSTQGSTINSYATSISTLQGQMGTALARAGVRLDVNGYVTGWETNNNGQQGNFIINADNFEIRKPGGGAGLTWSAANGGTLTVSDGSGNTTEIGYLS